MQEIGTSPKTHLSGSILHTVVDTGLALMCGQDVDYTGGCSEGGMHAIPLESLGTVMFFVSAATLWRTPLICLPAVNLTLMAFSVCGQLLQVRVITEPQLLWNLLPCYWTHGYGRCYNYDASRIFLHPSLGMALGIGPRPSHILGPSGLSHWAILLVSSPVLNTLLKYQWELSSIPCCRMAIYLGGIKKLGL